MKKSTILIINLIIAILFISVVSINTLSKYAKNKLKAQILEDRFEVEILEETCLAKISRKNGISSILYKNENDKEIDIKSNGKKQVAIDFKIVIDKEFVLEIKDMKNNITTEKFTLKEIEFYGNGNDGGETAKKIYVKEKGLELPENGFNKDGYYFIGWTNSPDNQNVIYSDKEKIDNVENEALYAVWEKAITISFDGNGAKSGTMSEQLIRKGVDSKLNKNNFEAQYLYEFKGWSKTKGTTTIDYNDEEIVNITSDMTLYAVWEFYGVLVENIELNRNSIRIIKDDTNGFTLTTTISPSNATDKSLIWEIVETNKQNLATVSYGRIVPKGIEGTFTVKCKAKYGTENAYATCTVMLVSHAYSIYTADDFLMFASDPNGEYYVMNDIDMTGKPYVYKRGVNFKGTLDGQGFTISNLKLVSIGSRYRWENYTGLVDTFRGTARNILFKDVYLQGYDDSYVGGVLGASTYEATIEKIGITGIINRGGGAFFGNTANVNPGTTFKDCYARCSISKQSSQYDMAGFLCCSTNNGFPTFTNCYFAGTISGKYRVGSMLSSSSNENNVFRGTYINCYYNSQLFTVTSAANATPLTTSQFANKNNFAGWDFTNTWYIDPTTGYPELKF